MPFKGIVSCSSTFRIVRLFVLSGQGFSLLWTPALRPFESVQCASPGRGGESIGVCDVRAMCGKEGKVGLSSLSGIFKRAPLCVTKPGLAYIQQQP